MLIILSKPAGGGTKCLWIYSNWNQLWGCERMSKTVGPGLREKANPHDSILESLLDANVLLLQLKQGGHQTASLKSLCLNNVHY